MNKPYACQAFPNMKDINVVCLISFYNLQKKLHYKRITRASDPVKYPMLTRTPRGLIVHSASLRYRWGTVIFRAAGLTFTSASHDEINNTV